jgi:signal transduction histidine kinase
VVSDTGIGIAPAELGSVLELFGKGARAGQLQLGGAELGLALCKALTEARDGTFTMRKQVG